MTTSKLVYQLKVTLDDSKPPIWRRLLVLEDTSLFTLHKIIQRAMGWQDYHLHMFTIAGQIYGDPADDETGDLGTKNEKRFRLNQFGFREKVKFSYEYDFGDGWDHTILIEKILPADASVRYPVCITGKHACPPEDVGGVWGYDSFLETISNPDDPEYDEKLEWIGGEFDPEEFDLDGINQALQRIKPTRGGKKSKLEPESEESLEDVIPPEALAQIEKLAAWFQQLTRDQLDIFENLSLRKNVLVFLDYLSKNKVVGTQATGNLPLKAIQEIVANFTPPISMEYTIGGQTFKVRSEDEVWPLFFVHHLAFHSFLVEGGQAKTWKVTQAGQNFIQSPAPVQVFLLFALWWTDVDWMIVFSGGYGPSDDLPKDFPLASLACLQELPVGEKVDFEPFANHLIEKGRLKRDFGSILVSRTVVDVMQMFGVLDCEYVTDNSNGYEVKKLKSICLTPSGKQLLAFIK